MWRLKKYMYKRGQKVTGTGRKKHGDVEGGDAGECRGDGRGRREDTVKMEEEGMGKEERGRKMKRDS